MVREWLKQCTQGLVTFTAANDPVIRGTVSPSICFNWLLTTSTADPVVKPLINGSDKYVATTPSFATPMITYRKKHTF